MASKASNDRFHGRVGGKGQACAQEGCHEPGEFRARDRHGRSGGPNGPGDYRWLCLDHVREHNARYNWFDGMTQEEILAAQSPVNSWASETRAFRATAGVDSPPKWADFADPLDAISARFKQGVADRMPHQRADGYVLSAEDRRALKTLGLGHDADRKAIRTAYSALARAYHPDRNGGDRSKETLLSKVVEAYQHLRKSVIFG